MLSVLSGLVITGAGGTTLWYCLPRNGQLNPLIRKPFMDFTVPIGIVTAIALGVALIVAGIVS